MSTLIVNNQFSTQSPRFRPSQAREQPPPGLNMSCRIKPQFMPRDIHCQVIEYKYVVNLHWGWIWEISAFSFLFWNFYLNNASSVGQTRCNCSDHLFIRGVFSTQPMFQSMEPTGACQVYILPRHQATSIFDKKIWRKKTRIVTFSGKLYIVSSIVCHLTKLENMSLFLY